MAAFATTKSTDELDDQNPQDTETQLRTQHISWKALFSFTTRKHLPTLVIALVSAAIAALTLPAIAVLYGLIFREFAKVGADTISGSTFLHNVSKYCIYLAAFGGLNWLTNSIFFMAFITFGELQARSARDRIFSALLRKDMAWYDTRSPGVAALLTNMQT